jgi:hypothetical protein
MDIRQKIADVLMACFKSQFNGHRIPGDANPDSWTARGDVGMLDMDLMAACVMDYIPQWQSIDTVPDNVNRILGLCPDYINGGFYATECEYHKGSAGAMGWWEFSDGNPVFPTHWQLPPALPLTTQ